MERGLSSWFPPLTGVIAIVLAVAGFAIAGEGQDATEKSAQEIVDYYSDNEGKQFGGSFLIGLSSVALVFFGGWLRRVLRDAEGPEGILSAVAFGGTIVLATGFAVAGAINIALADLADDIDPVALQAINGISWSYYLPFAAGMGIIMLASGISVVRHGALPNWLGWVAVVIGVVQLTPAGFFAFLVGGVWIAVVSVMGALRARGSAAPAAPST